jgi:hypothetical protein
VLQHIAEMDRYYLACLGRGESPDLGGDPANSIRTSFDEVERFVRDLSAQEHRERRVDEAGEEWTTMKFLRRRTGHIREHMPELDELHRDANV